ncbi:hypothetical protein MMC26_002496 [Xylographa opegraphella]|nr:hypothetical protein [Xylographa opegraphella]
MDTIPSSFTIKKNNILENLSTPDDKYSDLSPKGSVDTGIRELISNINKLDGLVTTSSCAGRISVFLEGAKTESSYNGQQNSSIQVAVPGGKGKGGRWLFVSHDPVNKLDSSSSETRPFMKILGMSKHGRPPMSSKPETTRFVKFQFEPMILHVMAASLHHAQPVLAAAINAGFRESGVQSLKNLDDPKAFPMVAIRSSGIGLSSLVGYASDIDGEDDVQCMVEESYLELLLNIANDRFLENSKRVERFRNQLLQSAHKRERHWEDGKVRRERLKAEGLEERSKKALHSVDEDHLNHDSGDISLLGLYLDKL